MTDLLQRCSVCRALVYTEDLFCSNCGAEAPHSEGQTAQPAHRFTHNFECRGCGASMSYDASAQTLRCPFCGSTNLEDRPDTGALGPRRVVPFTVSEEAATTALRKWLGNGFWRPSDLSGRAAITNMTAVYVPFWIFSSSTLTYWTADSSQTPPGASGDWFPMTGRHRGEYRGHLIGASSVLTPAETNQLCPFDMSRAVSPDEVDLENVVVEQFRVQRKYAMPLARQGLDDLERQACQQYVPGRSRNLKVNVRLSGLTSEPVLLPVWILAYRYRDQVYRFLLNGQSGRATGTAPTSWKKMVAVVAGIVLAGLLALACAGLVGGR